MAAVIALSVLLLSCASTPTPEQRRARADRMAVAKGWQALRISAGDFDLLAYVPMRDVLVDTLSIYIEGDGFAWRTPSLPSTDPTPREAVALALALAQPEGTAVYLARPCQFTGPHARGCDERYWTEARFAPEVVSASDQAVEQLKRRFGARRLVLVGFSGGGAVAALLAARRSDVARLITVAGNLDHAAWTRLHGMDPLTASLNAADHGDLLRDLPQVHFVGRGDAVVPVVLARGFPAGFLGIDGANLRVVEGADHRCCWAAQWPSLWRAANPP